MPIRKTLYVTLAVLLIQGCTYNLVPRSYSAESIEAWVVDETTGKPLEGVIVVAHWPLEVERHDSWVGELQIMETVTDRNGRFYFPAWGPKYAERGHLTYRDPEILLYRDGYAWKRLHNEFTTEISYRRDRSCRWNGSMVSMKNFEGGAKKYAEHLDGLDALLGFLYKRHTCHWKSAPNMLMSMHKKRVYFTSHKISFGPRTVGALGNDCGAKSYFGERL